MRTIFADYDPRLSFYVTNELFETRSYERDRLLLLRSSKYGRLVTIFAVLELILVVATVLFYVVCLRNIGYAEQLSVHAQLLITRTFLAVSTTATVIAFAALISIVIWTRQNPIPKSLRNVIFSGLPNLIKSTLFVIGFLFGLTGIVGAVNGLGRSVSNQSIHAYWPIIGICIACEFLFLGLNARFNPRKILI